MRDRELTVAQRSQAQLVLRRFRQHRLAVVSLVVLLALVLLAFVGGWLWKYSVVDFTPDESQSPSWDHPFGTDAAGLDTFALVLRGTQISIGISVLVAIFSTVVGTIWGATAGYYRGTLDTVMMRGGSAIIVDFADKCIQIIAISPAAEGAHDRVNIGPIFLGGVEFFQAL